jgi:hypothetical protein
MFCTVGAMLLQQFAFVLLVLVCLALPDSVPLANRWNN